MLNRSSATKRPRDVNQLAKSVVDIATGSTDDFQSDGNKNPAAVALGGQKGGRARAKKLSPEERQRIAKIAADARWKKDGQS